jgi:Tol biopolymer transport system component
VRGTQTRFTFDTREDETSVWSPDGRWIAWTGFVRGTDDRAVFRRPADSSGVEELLWSGSLHAHVTDWTPDGQRLVLEVAHPQRRGGIQVLNLSGSRELQPFAATDFDETSGRVSPDGRWLAYQSNESGRYEIYVQRFPAGGGKIQASAAGGVQPVWSRDGRELYFRTPADVMRVSVSAGDTATLGAPIAMFKDVYERIQADNHTTYDVLPDGRFVFIQRLAASESTVENPYVMAVFNWADELRQKLGR